MKRLTCLTLICVGGLLLGVGTSVRADDFAGPKPTCVASGGTTESQCRQGDTACPDVGPVAGKCHFSVSLPGCECGT